MKPEHPHKGELYLLSVVAILMCSIVAASWPVTLPVALILVFLFLFAIFAVQ